MTKPCRDSKGKFVSRGEKVKKITQALFILQRIWRSGNGKADPIMASLFRQFRNRYKIYECF